MSIKGIVANKISQYYPHVNKQQLVLSLHIQVSGCTVKLNVFLLKENMVGVFSRNLQLVL